MAPANVWRGYDQAGLDHQYNSRGTVPDASVYLREYAARTRDAKAKLACSENLPYGVGADEVLDIYPAARSGAAVLVFLHLMLRWSASCSCADRFRRGRWCA